MNKLENVNECPLCKSKNKSYYTKAKSIFTLNQNIPETFDVSICNDCTFTYLSTRPKKEDISSYYAEDSAYYEKPKKLLKSTISRMPNKKKVLDVGFGNCQALLSKYNEGWTCYGTDLIEHAVKKGKEFYPWLNLKQGELIDANYPNNYFDLILLSHVLEHDYDPVALIKEVKRVLKKGGRVIIDVPNFDGLYYSIFGKNCEFFVPQHLSFFTPKTLSSVILRAGFKNYKIKTIFGNNTSYHILHKLGLQKSYYKKTLIFNKLLGLFVYPVEIIFNKGDALRAYIEK